MRFSNDINIPVKLSSSLQLDLIDKLIGVGDSQPFCRHGFLLNRILEIKNFSVSLFLPANSTSFGAAYPLPIKLVSIVFITTQE